MITKIFSILTVIFAILVLWYAAAFMMNKQFAIEQASKMGKEIHLSSIIKDTWSQKRPRLPAPHQILAEFWKTTGEMVIKGQALSKRSLIYHSLITLSPTLLGFFLGSLLGILLAVAIVYSRIIDLSIMPWIIASQAIPILAIAPMIIIVLNSVGIQGVFPKSIISAYLSFFPVAVGMVKGLRSPNKEQIDLLATYNTSRLLSFWKLRLPSSMPYFFTSLKIAMAASLVGAIIGELPTGAISGLGARMLSGSYYGQTLQIWSALLAAAILVAILVGIIDFFQYRILKRMGIQA